MPAGPLLNPGRLCRDAKFPLLVSEPNPTLLEGLGEGLGELLEPRSRILPKPGMKANPSGPPTVLLALGVGLGGVRLVLAWRGLWLGRVGFILAPMVPQDVDFGFGGG